MKKHVLMLTCAFVLAWGATVAFAEESPGHEGRGITGCGMMGRGGMMGGHDGARSCYALHLRFDG
jgi:hypothetical protein